MNRRRPENANSFFCLFNQLQLFPINRDYLREKKGVIYNRAKIRLSYDNPEKYLKIYSG